MGSGIRDIGWMGIVIKISSLSSLCSFLSGLQLNKHNDLSAFARNTCIFSFLEQILTALERKTGMEFREGKGEKELFSRGKMQGVEWGQGGQ